jgi:hypothetical protein
MNDKVMEPLQPYCPKTGEPFWIYSLDSTGKRRRDTARIEFTPDGQESLFINKEFVAALSCANSEKERREQVATAIDKYNKNKN